MSDQQKSMASGLRWTNFQYELLSSESTNVQVPSVLLESQTEVDTTSVLSSSTSSRKLLQTTPNAINVTIAFAEAQRQFELRRLALVAYIAAKEKEKDEDVCIDEHDCVIRMLNRVLVICILFAVVVSLHVALMITWLRWGTSLTICHIY